MELQKEYGDIVYSRMGPYRAFFFFHQDQIRDTLAQKSKLVLKFLPQVRVLSPVGWKAPVVKRNIISLFFTRSC
jgi:hypothetical protein